MDRSFWQEHSKAVVDANGGIVSLILFIYIISLLLQSASSRVFIIRLVNN